MRPNCWPACRTRSSSAASGGAAEGGKTLKVYDPATGEVVKEIADASPADGKAALDAAAAAFPAVGGDARRASAREILRRAFDLLQERKEDFALLMTLEMGKPLAEARGEVAYGGEFLRWFSEEAARIQGRYGLEPRGHRPHDRVAASGRARAS